MTQISEARKRLAQLMEERRLELAVTWTDVATAGGTTTETLRQARFGASSIAPLSKRAIEKGLRWTQGSVDRVLGGGDPKPADAATSGAAVPVGAGVDPVLLARLAEEAPEEIARVEGYIQSIIEGRRD